MTLTRVVQEMKSLWREGSASLYMASANWRNTTRPGLGPLKAPMGSHLPDPHTVMGRTQALESHLDVDFHFTAY